MMPEEKHTFWKQWASRLANRLRHPLSGGQPPYGWEAVLDTIEDWICIIDLRAKIIRSNTNCQDLFHLPAPEIIGKTCCSLLHHSTAPLPGCPLQRMITSGKRETQELEIREGKWMLVTVDPIFGSGGNLLGAVHISRDVTRRVLIQNERERLVKDLKNAVKQIKTLSGLLPICASCKKIRDDKGYWNLIESYIESHSQASFSHSLCPECMDEIYGQEEWYLKLKTQKTAQTGS
jgi:PAS domain S-box-containing protein